MNNRAAIERYAAKGALALCVLYAFVILISWVVASSMPQLPLRSILSSEGVRWLFGHFTSNISGSMLAWLLLIAVAYGVIKDSGMVASVILLLARKKLPYRHLLALRFVAGLLMVLIAILVLLTCIPHAILLSVNGHLFPSSFSRSLIPILCFIGTVSAVTFGLVCGRYTSLVQVFRALIYGITAFSPTFFIYILVAQLYYTILYIVPL
ncbi:MAG: ABC transporter substrate-binding protein [Hoylesella marshii]|jgi:brp/blh family beta-carotene 15,15'-monooxygenase|uniref:AbgT transporter family protein n=1 Tax=Hoylesella marshii DSM 16973 = JCM 13450 TaxID=862515 RepID=E0NPZ7_9BACT|nr:hypothetical protein [Hoylesella marshii]EFM02873.1 hypothetical protein HMPREF0658_0248 [Hoylesella marshii DSM 16973 = JCM 13450]